MTGTWIFLSITIEEFNEASNRYTEIWKINSTIQFGLAIVLGIFSIIYFARAQGILSKIFMIVQILIVTWFCWSLL